jgi:hypothetical protein
MTNGSGVVIPGIRKSRMASASARQSASQLLEDRRLCIVKRSRTGREEMNRAWALFRPCWYQFGGTNGVLVLLVQKNFGTGRSRIPSAGVVVARKRGSSAKK